MPKRKNLKGIASGIAGSFISRNNDAEGYWAMGKFYKIAVEENVKILRLNLISGISCPQCSFSWSIAELYYNFLVNQLSSSGLAECHLSDAEVELEFNIDPTKKQINSKQTWGEAFLCRVIITDDLAKKHICETRGWCGQHDSKKELRRSSF